MLTVCPLYCPAAGVPSTAQASRMRGRRHAAAKSLPARVSVNGSVVAPGKGPSRRARSRSVAGLGRSAWPAVPQPNG